MKTCREPLLVGLVRSLEGAKGSWSRISRESGVPYFTLVKIARRQVTDPRISTVEKLLNHFEQAA